MTTLTEFSKVNDQFNQSIMKILVTGSDGQLGSEIKDIAVCCHGFDFLFTDKDQLDVTDYQQVLDTLQKNKIDCIVNCAGYTAVDKAEEERAAARLLNTTAVGHLARAAASLGALLIHVSTDYVFNGKGYRPYTEDDIPVPASMYGKTKLEGEDEIIRHAGRAAIIRTSWLYSAHGANFVKTILNKAMAGDELKVVFDQVGSPTYAADLAQTILDIIPELSAKKKVDIYHYSNEGVASWFDFAKAIVEIKGIDCKITPILTKEIQSKAPRPHYSLLDKSRIKKDFGLQIPHWRESLGRCLQRL